MTGPPKSLPWVRGGPDGSAHRTEPHLKKERHTGKAVSDRRGADSVQARVTPAVVATTRAHCKNFSCVAGRSWEQRPAEGLTGLRPGRTRQPGEPNIGLQLEQAGSLTRCTVREAVGRGREEDGKFAPEKCVQGAQDTIK